MMRELLCAFRLAKKNVDPGFLQMALISDHSEKDTFKYFTPEYNLPHTAKVCLKSSDWFISSNIFRGALHSFRGDNMLLRTEFKKTIYC